MGVMNIYNASAGSGKTYTLVREYLKIILSSHRDDTYKNILAITFTNKAAAEMKLRILSTLELFSDISKAEKDSMFRELSAELSVHPEILCKKSQSLLKNILHDYSSLSISTIDSFTTRLVRSFSAELKLPVGFEIVLDNKDILNSAVDMLLLRAGKDKKLSELLLGFISQNIDNQSSWDVSKLLIQAADISSKENNIPAMDLLSEKSIDDFISLRSRLINYKKSIEQSFSQVGEKACDIIYNRVGTDKIFTGKSTGVASLFRHARDLNIDKINIDSAHLSNFLSGKCYASDATQSQKEIVDSVYDELFDLSTQLIELVEEKRENYTFCRSVISPLDKMSVISEIDSQIKSIKDQDSVMLIHEFNKIISRHIRQEPVPFIYEKIGEKYKHYFVDEFQDTSTLQWDNLRHLIYNQLSSDGSALIVGDAKQAIYRWRGGDSDQFIALCDDSVREHFEKKIKNLDTNYRSASTIVEFTNDFFRSTAPEFLNDYYSAEYIKGNTQKAAKKTIGFVSIRDIQGETVAQRTQPILDAILTEIRRCVDQDGFSYKDIAVLCNTNTQGAMIAQWLKNQSVEVISAESLFLSSSEYVRFVVAVLRLAVAPYNKEARMTILNFMDSVGVFSDVEDKAEFFSKTINHNQSSFVKTIEHYNQEFKISLYISLPLYESIEYLINSFNLWDKGEDEYLLYFIDFAAQYIRYNPASVSGFLDHWGLNSDKTCVASAEGTDAVSIMTIHKSKGLEFPVVIVPFCDWKIKKDEEVWTVVPAEDAFEGLDIAYLPLNKVKDCGMEKIYSEYYSKIVFDNMNKLYVALTRPKTQLHIITTLPAEVKEFTNISCVIKKFVQDHPWGSEEYIFQTGERLCHTQSKEEKTNTYPLNKINSTQWTDKLSISLDWKKIWNTAASAARDQGNKIHAVLSFVSDNSDINRAMAAARVQGFVKADEADQVLELVTEIVNHSELADYFDTQKYQSFNERELIDDNGSILRPDRLCIRGENVVVIDYKTGEYNTKHNEQLYSYSSLLEKIGYIVEKRILVYIDKKGIKLIYV